MLIQIPMLNMTSISVISTQDGKRKEHFVHKWFMASEIPQYIAIVTKPSPGLWEHLSQSKAAVLEVDGKSYNYSIPYRIEVGESTIFFVTPSDADQPDLS